MKHLDGEKAKEDELRYLIKCLIDLSATHPESSEAEDDFFRLLTNIEGLKKSFISFYYKYYPSKEKELK